MLALSLWQPFGLLWLSPAKIHETRHWSTNVRGTIAVHAAKTREGMDDAAGYLDAVLKKHFGDDWQSQIAYGAIIGTLDLTHCYRIGQEIEPLTEDDQDCGNFAPGRFLFRRGAYTRFDKPIPWRGAQGFFRVPDYVLPGRKDLLS